MENDPIVFSISDENALVITKPTFCKLEILGVYSTKRDGGALLTQNGDKYYKLMVRATNNAGLSRIIYEFVFDTKKLQLIAEAVGAFMPDCHSLDINKLMGLTCNGVLDKKISKRGEGVVVTTWLTKD